MRINWKKTIIGILDIVLGVYLVFAITSFNKPDETAKVCTKVGINIADETTNGFLSAAENPAAQPDLSTRKTNGVRAAARH